MTKRYMDRYCSSVLTTNKNLPQNKRHRKHLCANAYKTTKYYIAPEPVPPFHQNRESIAGNKNIENFRISEPPETQSSVVKLI